MRRITLLNGATTVAAGSSFSGVSAPQSFQGTVIGTGAVTATIVVQVSNDAGGNWFTLGTISLSGTTSATDGFTSQASWDLMRGNITAISGTGAAVTLIASY
jgi:hypothetical protein